MVMWGGCPIPTVTLLCPVNIVLPVKVVKLNEATCHRRCAGLCGARCEGHVLNYVLSLRPGERVSAASEDSFLLVI